MIDVREITDLHAQTVALWHREDVLNLYTGFLQAVCQQHTFNYLLWHEEDVARSPNVGDERIAAVKRAIDGYNQKRNDGIEKLDAFLLNELAGQIVPQAGARQNTETPGSTIDRLSILSLRRYHMQEQADRADASAEHRRQSQRPPENPGRAAPRPFHVPGRTPGRHLRRPQASESLLSVQDVQRPDDEPLLV